MQSCGHACIRLARRRRRGQQARLPHGTSTDCGRGASTRSPPTSLTSATTRASSGERVQRFGRRRSGRSGSRGVGRSGSWAAVGELGGRGVGESGSWAVGRSGSRRVGVVIVHIPLAACRRKDDTESWWMSGRSDSMFFYRVYRGAHGDARLGKVPGDMVEDLGSDIQK